jgi:hypothetical protein
MSCFKTVEMFYTYQRAFSLKEYEDRDFSTKLLYIEEDITDSNNHRLERDAFREVAKMISRREDKTTFDFEGRVIFQYKDIPNIVHVRWFERSKDKWTFIKKAFRLNDNINLLEY